MDTFYRRLTWMLIQLNNHGDEDRPREIRTSAEEVQTDIDILQYLVVAENMLAGIR